ncbi:MAG: hypothetical protein HY757_10075 [Nitrospirae bacterium]|nr:hypothetical protein [Nitrospirota bacterium]
MNDLKKGTENPELFNAIKESVKDARYSAQKLSEVFTENIQPLRMEENERVFIDFIHNIKELECFLDFIKQLKEGMRFFEGFGLPSDPIMSQDSGINLFNEMNSALESKDWIMLSDLIEYELSPLLMKEDEWLSALDEKILGYNA